MIMFVYTMTMFICSMIMSVLYMTMFVYSMTMFIFVFVPSLSTLHGRPVWRHAAGLDQYLTFACRLELHTIPPMNEQKTSPPLTHTACVFVYDNSAA